MDQSPSRILINNIKAPSVGMVPVSYDQGPKTMMYHPSSGRSSSTAATSGSLGYIIPKYELSEQPQVMDRISRSQMPIQHILYSQQSYVKPELSINFLNLKLIENPNDVDARLARARRLELLGNTNEAIQDYQYVLSIYPENMTAQVALQSLF